jgi:hypothetical protein
MADNEVEPTVEKSGDTLTVKSACRCGAEALTWTVDDVTQLILSNMHANREANRPLEISYHRSAPASCSRCGRQWVVHFVATLAKPWVEKVEKEFTHAHEALVYGDILHIDLEIKNGRFSDTRQILTSGTLQRLVNPVHFCNSKLPLATLMREVETMIAAIDNFWTTDNRDIKNRDFKFKEKCLFCLNEIECHAKIEARLPKINEKPSEIIKLHEAWLKRAII